MAKRRTPDTDSESDASDNEATQSKRVRLEVEKPGDVDSGETLEEKELAAKFGDRIRRAIETGEKLKGVRSSLSLCRFVQSETLLLSVLLKAGLFNV